MEAFSLSIMCRGVRGGEEVENASFHAPCVNLFGCKFSIVSNKGFELVGGLEFDKRQPMFEHRSSFIFGV
jgi:hypothetical protein